MTISDIDILRLMTGERIPPGGTVADTFFSDKELAEILDATGGQINAAAVFAWAAKAGEYARQVDLNESGASRYLSQRYRQAAAQLSYYQKQADKELRESTTQGRAVGRAFSIGDSARSNKIILWTKRYNRMPVFDALALVNPDGVVQYEETYSDRP